jgi:hypothetical protein
MENKNLNQKQITSAAAVQTASVDPIAVTPASVLEQLRSVRQLIPAVVPIPTALIMRRGRMPYVDTDFVNATITATGTSPALEGALMRSADDVRQYNEETILWGAVEDEVRTLLQAIVATNAERRQRVGVTAMQTYDIARALVRQPEHADLKPHVQQMTRMNKFGRNRRRKPAPQPSTQPVPQ